MRGEVGKWVHTDLEVEPQTRGQKAQNLKLELRLFITKRPQQYKEVCQSCQNQGFL